MVYRSPRLLISCVGEDTSPYHRKILNLFKTIKVFGGELGNEKLVANFVGSIKKDVKTKLEDIGVNVRIVQPFDSRSPHCNKLRMLEMEDDYDVLIALDCDTVVVRDFTREINPKFFQAKPVNNDPLSIRQWEGLFSYFNLDCPKKRVETTGVKQLVTIPYFNSGVLAIPKKYVSQLRDAWGKYARLLMDNYHKMGQIGKYKYFADQHALSLALADQKIPYKEFPVEMNFSTPIKMKPKFLPHKMHPYILHYHKYVLNNGLLMKTRFKYATPNSYIGKVNRFLRRE
ncbi:hypothetical protein [Niallia oryzisoli]|uniref:hypothetical protein n=1 Tax=Niallia oryzisoli TaxID=1737571 RepID=UPI0037351D3C